MSYGEMEQQYTAALQKLIELQKKYGLDSTETLKAQKKLAEFQVVTPLLGEFSTGKSSLINAMLGNKILGENITPETAVPTEICYGEQEKAIIYSKDNEPSKELTLEEYKQCSFSASETHKVRLYLNHPFLKEIETVRIVDMPGFNSGIELHNRAIDEYLPEAEAYLLTFDARTPTISEDMANFIKELKLHEVPVYFLITKSRAVTEDECRICTDRIRQDAEKYLGLPQVSIGVTNAKGKIKILEPFHANESSGCIEEGFAETLNLKSFKNQLLKVIVEHFDLGSAEYSPDYFRLVTERTLNNIRFPAIHLTLDSFLNKISSQFSGEIRDGEKRNELKNLLAATIGDMFTYLAQELEKETQKFHEELKKCKEIFAQQLMQDINNDFEKIVKACDAKEASIQKLQACSKVLEDWTRELND